MSDRYPWSQALGINADQIAGLSGQVGADQSVISWCIANQKVDGNKYLEWAMQHYGLALLKSDFFQQSANEKLFSVMKDVANWSAEMLPVYEWDGVVFIACLEPNFDHQWSFPVQMVLAEPEALQSYWNRISAAPDATVEKSEPAIKTKTFADIPKVPDEQTQTSTVTKTVSGDGSPAGLDFGKLSSDNKKAAEADPSNILHDDRLDPAEEEAADEVVEEAPEMMEGLSSSEELTKTNMDSPAGLNFDALDKLVADNVGEEPAAAEPVIAAPAAEAPEAIAPEPPADVIVAAAPVEPPVEAPAAVAAEPEPSTSVTETTTVGVLVEKVRPQPSKEDAAIYSILGGLQDQFENCLLLIQQNELLVPWKWNDSWGPTREEHLKGVDLDGPSIFRIVHRTKLPYHGYVVDSSINSEFFRQWGMGEPPKHVTLTPLKSGSHVIGMLLVTSSEDKGDSRSLELVESKTDELTQVIHNETSRAA